MIQELADRDRRVLPRWRDSVTTIATGELGQAPAQDVRVRAASDFLREKQDAWQAERTTGAAAELVSAGVVLGREADVVRAAEFLLAAQSRATPLVRRLASRALERAGRTLGARQQHPDQPAELARARIHALRHRLRDEPRNALLWVDLAREYSILGLGRQASRAMDVALAIAETNRFVVRSAVRLFVHLDDPARAHDVVRRSARTRHDPWLLAAEIAVASLVDRTSRNVRDGTEIVTSGRHAPFHTAELASALATLELGAGKNRSARRLFEHSLRDPTDNAVAQAGWAAQRLSSLTVAEKAFETPRSYEARAYRGYGAGRWEEAVRECRAWLFDEPYSERPAILGSMVSGMLLDDYETSRRFCQEGLIANPASAVLRNNLAVALANLGRVDEAAEAIAGVEGMAIRGGLECAVIATHGLIQFRRGLVEEGRAIYVRAIARADELGLPNTRLRAMAYLAREEILANTPRAIEALTTALLAVPEQSLAKAPPDLSAFLRRLRDRLNQQLAAEGPTRPAPSTG